MADFNITALETGLDFDHLPYWDVVIIGAGPAGLAAGLTTVHRALTTLVTSIAGATRALVERRPSLAQRVVDEDDEVDRLELEIDDICFQLLAREQPVASDLRFITTAMKIVGDIERIGDNGVNIARRALEIMHEPELKPIIDIPVAAAAAQRILKESLDAFVTSDANLAKRVIQDDRYIDDVCEQMLRELLTYMFEDPSTVSRALRLMFVARNLERIGDHAANIAEMVIFLVEAQDVRHRQAAKAQARA